MLTLDKIYHASYVLKDVIRRTELIHAPNINPKGKVFLNRRTYSSQARSRYAVRTTRFHSCPKRRRLRE